MSIFDLMHNASNDETVKCIKTEKQLAKWLLKNCLDEAFFSDYPSLQNLEFTSKVAKALVDGHDEIESLEDCDEVWSAIENIAYDLAEDMESEDKDDGDEDE